MPLFPNPSPADIQNALRAIAHVLPKGHSVTIENGDLVDLVVGDRHLLLRTQDFMDYLFPAFVVETVNGPNFCKCVNGRWMLFGLRIGEPTAWVPLCDIDDYDVADLRAQALPKDRADVYHALVHVNN